MSLTKKKVISGNRRDTFILEGKTTINDACKAMKIERYFVGKGDSESMAGLVLELSGEFPHQPLFPGFRIYSRGSL
jgi:hypothetical protein